MSDEEVFGGWTTDALKGYLKENGASIPQTATKTELVAACGRLARSAEQQQFQRTNGGQRAPHQQNQPAVGVPTTTARPQWPPPLQTYQQQTPYPTVPTPHNAPPPAAVVPRPLPREDTNRKRALIIGVNYYGIKQAELQGCINDARCMSYLLEHRLNFPQSNILLMADDHPDPLRRPTKQNIFMGIQWLMTGLRSGDSLIFHFSGHGSQQRDYSGMEADGMNETICPLDFKYAGEIVDDELNRMLVQPLPTGVKLHAVIDACHSGSAMDLPYQAICRQGHIMWQTELAPQHARMKSTAGGFAIQISASMDHQTAADTNRMTGVHTGAATYSFIKCLEERGLNISYRDLLLGMYYSLQAVTGGGGGGGGGGGLGGMLGGLLGSAMGGSAFQGQEPVLSAGYVFDLNYKLEL